VGSGRRARPDSKLVEPSHLIAAVFKIGAAFGSLERPEDRYRGEEVRRMNKETDAKASWFRLLITVVLDWRLVMAIVLLVLVVLLRK
jgi:hypothetical protein